MLELHNIYKSFSERSRPVLNGVNLKLEKEEFCVLIGDNGSGKSTLIKSISGEHFPDSGLITLNGQNITYLPIHKRAKLISTVSQDINKGTVQSMTLFENLSLSYLRNKNASYACYQKHKEQLTEKIECLGLKNYIDMPMSTLSGGQQQIIATIMATLSTPALLLLDEHCSALDPKASENLMKYTTKIIERLSITTLMITHNLNDAIRYGNRLIKMQDGKIVLDVKGNDKKNLTAQQLYDLFNNDKGRHNDSDLF